MTTATWEQVGEALLGSWPGTIVAWGADAIDLYVKVLKARGLEADQALKAILTWPAGSDFPPSAPNLAAAALHDPSLPTFEELFRLIFGPRGVLFARAPYVNGEYVYSHDEAGERMARLLHPLAAGFILQQRVSSLRMLQVDDERVGALVRKDLAAAWERFCEAYSGREVAALASGDRRGGLERLNPLAALGRPRPLEIGAGE